MRHLFGMWGHAVDYNGRDTRRWNGGRARSWSQPLHLGFWLHEVPRLVLRCRLLGHKPVVDGTKASPYNPEHRGHRWVCCARCGRRGNLQGDLDPAVYAIGDRYLGPWAIPFPDEESPEYDRAWRLAKLDGQRGYTPPGPIPRGDRGVIGGELVVGRNFGQQLGFELKVGHAGSDHTLAARLSFGVLGALYLHTSDGWGDGIQRWLNPAGHESRVTGVDFGLDEVRWKVWARRDGYSGDGVREPRWRDGGIHLRPLDRLLGPKRFSFENVPGCVDVGRMVRLPEDDYLVTLTLRRQTLGRRRGRKRHAWTVDWSVAGRGLPTKGPDRGRVFGSSASISNLAVREGTWPAEAAARIALQVAEWRTQHSWDPITTVKPEHEETSV